MNSPVQNEDARPSRLRTEWQTFTRAAAAALPAGSGGRNLIPAPLVSRRSGSGTVTMTRSATITCDVRRESETGSKIILKSVRKDQISSHQSAKGREGRKRTSPQAKVDIKAVEAETENDEGTRG